MEASKWIPVTEKEKALIKAAIAELRTALSNLEQTMARRESPIEGANRLQ